MRSHGVPARSIVADIARPSAFHHRCSASRVSRCSISGSLLCKKLKGKRRVSRTVMWAHVRPRGPRTSSVQDGADGACLHQLLPRPSLHSTPHLASESRFRALQSRKKRALFGLSLSPLRDGALPALCQFVEIAAALFYHAYIQQFIDGVEHAAPFCWPIPPGFESVMRIEPFSPPHAHHSQTAYRKSV